MAWTTLFDDVSQTSPGKASGLMSGPPRLNSRNAQSCSGLTGRTSGLPFTQINMAYRPIENHGIIGDTQTVAIVGTNRALPVTVEELREPGALSALRPSLEALAAAMAAAGQTKGPFLTPGWLVITAAALANPRDRDRLRAFRLLVVP